MGTTFAHDVENSLRGILRGFGLKVGKTTPRSFAERVRELVTGHPALETIAQALLGVRAVLIREFNIFGKQVRVMARQHGQAKLLMTVPAVGPIVALTPACAGAGFTPPPSTIRRGSNPRKRPDRILG